MIECKEKKLDKISESIQSLLNDCTETFERSDDYILSELGGTFQPTCPEMVSLVASVPQKSYINVSSKKFFSAGDEIHFDNFAYRLYYEVLLQNTVYEFIFLRISGSGIFEVNVYAQTQDHEICVMNTVVDIQEDIPINTKFFDLETLPPSGSLTVKFRCLSLSGNITGYRWYGKILSDKANLGNRVYVIRTYGCRNAILTTLKSITDHLFIYNNGILQRTIFIIYDARSSSAFSMTNNLKHARIIELNGGNFGGGGNASLLISLILRGKDCSDNLSEVIIIDDDARIDAETIIRHDAFITGHKNACISSATVFSRQHPTVIQESCGFWGKFFLNNSGYVHASAQNSNRVLYPYLVCSQQDMADEFLARLYGAVRPAEFATFIFISFPYSILKKIGSPIPFFLRNDDVEVCLRANKYGIKVIANQNLQVWHDSSHSPFGEFYAILHGLIVNAAYDALDKKYLFITFMERISSQYKSGHYPMLLAYSSALHLFAEGAQWFCPESIYKVYKKFREDMNELISKSTVIPREVIYAHPENYQIIPASDNNPQYVVNKQVVFNDIINGIFYVFNDDYDSRAEKCLDDCIKNLSKISYNYDAIINGWKNTIIYFNHQTFWDDIEEAQQMFIIATQNVVEKKSSGKLQKIPDILCNKIEYRVNNNNNVIESNQTQIEKLPKNFNAERYLRLNPDIAASGMDPIEHWMRHGMFECRKY